jgi:hypothetical protein
MPNLLDPPTQHEELRRIKEFLRQLEDLLDAIVRRPENIIPGRHHEVLRAAWFEVRPRFARIELVPANWPDLERVGLTGATLRLELSIFNHARSELMDSAPELFTPPPYESPYPPPYAAYQPTEKPRGWWSRVRRLTRRTLKAADIVLGSIGKIPVFGLPAEGITQFKESVEEGAALADEMVQHDRTSNAPR